MERSSGVPRVSCEGPAGAAVTCEGLAVAGSAVTGNVFVKWIWRTFGSLVSLVADLAEVSGRGPAGKRERPSAFW